MEAPIHVLYVGRGACEDLATTLEGDEIDVETVDADAALVRSDAADCVVCEQDLGERTGLDFLAELRNRHPDLPLFLFPGDGDEALASEAITAGVTEYVPRTGPDACDHLAERIRSVAVAADGRSERQFDAASPDRSDDERAACREKTLVELHENTRDLMTGDSRPEICETVARTAKELLGQPFASVYLYDEETNRLNPVASTEETREQLGDPSTIGPGDSTVWHTFETGELVHRTDVKEAERVYDPETEIRTELQIPIGEFGVLVASSTERQEFPGRLVDFAQLVAADAEAALERAQRIELLRRREQEVQSSRKRLQQIAEHIDSAVWMTDLTGTELFYVSEGHEEVYGTEVTPGDDPKDLLVNIHEADRERVENTFGSRIAEVHEITYRINHPESGLRWVRARAFPIFEDGEAVRYAGVTDDITDRVLRERELERYKQIFETIQDRVCVLDEDDEFLLVNDPFLSMVGYERKELIGSHVSAVVADEDVECAVLSEGETPTTVETTILAADGEDIPVEIDTAALSESNSDIRGSVGVVRDISDRKRVKAELEQERDRLSSLFENIPDAVVRTKFCEGEPVIQAVNGAFECTFGVDADEIIGESLNDLIVPPDGAEAARRLDERAKRGEPIQEEVRRQTDTGIRNFLLRSVPMHLDGGGNSFEGYTIYTDITDQKTRERRRQVLNRVLRHNMRNEMNVISGYAELVEPDADAERLETAATAIARTASDVAELSNKIRDIERTFERDEDDRYPVDLVTLVGRVVGPYADDTVDLETDLPDRLTVTADEGLGRALEHLLDNAVEHNDRAVPSVRVAGRRVDEDWAEVEIRDDGPGIPETERAVLTGDREITQLDHGSGLGLWLANWIVTALGGEVRFEDNDSRGSIVTVRLPTAD